MFSLLMFSVASSMASIVTSVSIQVPSQANTITDSTSTNQEEVIHCYCNFPKCVSTGYMCKSQRLGCFSDLVSNLDVERALHGCLDLLPSERGGECQNVPPAVRREGPAEPRTASSSASLLLCCKQDMCNHVDSPETRTKYNETILASAFLNGSERESVAGRPSMVSYSSQEVWFKAATIAVPICGAMILLMLVLLAMKILRSDVLDERSIISSKLRGKENHHGGGLVGSVVRCGLTEPSDKKHPLLFQYNPCTPGVHPVLLLTDKNARNAKLNSNLELTHSGLFHKSLDLGSCNIYNTTVPLLPPDKEKLVYKKAFVSWSNPM